MRARFLIHLKSCLNSLQHRLTVSDTPEDDRPFIGPAEVGTMIADYVLLRLAEEPPSCTSGCDLDDVPDGALLRLTGFTPEKLAAALVAAAVRLEVWVGARGVSFMRGNGVPTEDAWDVSRGAARVCDKLRRRSRALREEREDRRELAYDPV
jgi:hypothetical protein